MERDIAFRNFDRAFTSFYEGCQRIHNDYMLAQFPNNQRETWRIERLQKRIRVVQGSGVHSFVDLATGDVLRPAGWKVPAKHARGNIFDEHNGLKGMGPYGPAYLR